MAEGPKSTSPSNPRMKKKNSKGTMQAEDVNEGMKKQQPAKKRK